MATEYSLEMYSGESFDITVTVTDESGAAVDLTGASIAYAARDEIIKTTTNGGITITNAPAGQFTITLDSTDTAALGGRELPHDCAVTFASGEKRVVFVGTLTILKSYATGV